MKPVAERPLLPQVVPTNVVGLVGYTTGLGKQLLQVFGEFGFRLNRVLPKDGTEAMTAALPLWQVAQASVPSAASTNEGTILYVSDLDEFWASDGTAWTRFARPLATQTEAETGTDNESLMTPLRTAQAIAEQVSDTDTVNIAQVVNFQTGAVSTGTTVLPADDTIPQNTEGDEYMTLAITPTDAISTLIIEVVWNGAHSANTTTIVGLFQDATVNALAAAWDFEDAGGPQTIGFSHKMTAGTTSATTFKVRAGGAAAGTTTFNGFGGARKLGGVMASSITITEVLP